MRFRGAILSLALLAALALPAVTRAANAVDDNKVIYPKSSGTSSTTSGESSGSLGATTILGALILAGGGVWLLLRSRNARVPGRTSQSLAIDETKPLGNRQYLVVASYEGRKFLIGVCPGRIDLLSPLDGSEPAKAAR